jgi:phospholipase/lecithinase/hemolysin
MTKFREILLASLASVLLAACGGGGDGDQTPRVKFGKLVSFGDSLSDVGTYATPGLVGATGGGKYTVNSATAKIWVEDIAAAVKVTAPCAAQTGLQSTGPLAGFAAATTNHAGCFAYGQGGARVTLQPGPANQGVIALGDTSGYLGQLTDPVVNQIGRHLTAAGGSFAADDLVLVLAGGNDVFMNLAFVGAGAMTPTAAVTAMGTAGAELAGYVKALIVAKGAKYIVVVNLPDVSQTPAFIAAPAATQGLVQTMSKTFNSQLSAGLAGTAGVVYVDAFTQGQDQTAHPAQYGLTNVTGTACDPAKVASSLMCTAATLIAGDTSHYQFADSVHPTPYGYQLLAEFVAAQMAKAGWL